jgi:hypothetical protein
MLFASCGARADELFEMHINAREMGMGGAFISVVDDEESLWFNPAGIAKNNGIHWTILDPKVGISDPTDLKTLSDLKDASQFQSTLNGLYGKPIWAGGGAKSAVIIPGFAFGYYYDADASILADNPVDPTLKVNYVTDTGFAVGTGFSVAEILQMGMAVKYIERTGVRATYGPDTIASIVAGSADPSTIFNNLNNKGTGYSLDLGSNITVPSPIKPTFSLVWKDVGNTSFKPTVSGDPAPPTDPSDLRAGASVLIQVPFFHIIPAVEYRDILDNSIQMTDKLHLGVEVGLPLIDLRAGLYQGYLTYGAGFNLGLIDIDVASWGAEVGGAPGQLESRRYLAQVSLRLGFDWFGGGSKSSSSNGSSHNSSGDSSSDSSSRMFVKQRR